MVLFVCCCVWCFGVAFCVYSVVVAIVVVCFVNFVCVLSPII